MIVLITLTQLYKLSRKLTMALDERYVVASDLEQYFVRKDNGLPLSNGTLTFYRDSARNVPKPVYQLSGFPPNYTYTSMGAQITLSAVGTVQNSAGDNEVIYYFPYDSKGNLDLYYVVARDSGGNIQFTREAWPNVGSSTDPTKNQSDQTNQISNPTFTNVFINNNQPITYTASSASNMVFSFAPDWDFVISGTGTVLVQRIAITGNEKVPTSPPYVLDILISSGITACFLRQRFNRNSGLWSSTAGNTLFLSGSYVARNESVGTTGIQMFYAPSSGGAPVLIVDGTFQGDYELVYGSTVAPIPPSNDTNSGYKGFVDIYLSFVTGSHVKLTSLQVIPTKSSMIDFVNYDTDSSNRNEAYQADYYLPRAARKRIPSYLVGWDFAFNPFQFGQTGGSLVPSGTGYIADQTIGIRQINGNVTWGINTYTGGLVFNCSGTTNSFAIMQYLTGESVKSMIGTSLSCNVQCYQTGTTDAATGRIYLCRAPSTSTIPTIPNQIGGLSPDGQYLLLTGGWTFLSRSGLDTPQFNVFVAGGSDTLNDPLVDNGFSGWKMNATEIADTDHFLIIVSFYYPDANTIINVQSVSLVPGDLPSRPAIQKYTEVLNQCEYYYEKSYEGAVPEGTVTSFNARIQNCPVYLNGANDTLYAKTFGFPFKNPKRTIPNVRFYSPTSSVVNQFYLFLGFYNSATSANVPFTLFWTIINEGIKAIIVEAYSTAALLNISHQNWNEGYILYHYVADARLGIV